MLFSSEELSTAKMTYNSYIHQANDYRTQINDNGQELQVLKVRHENTKAAEAMQDTKVILSTTSLLIVNSNFSFFCALS